MSVLIDEMSVFALYEGAVKKMKSYNHMILKN